MNITHVFGLLLLFLLPASTMAQPYTYPVTQKSKAWRGIQKTSQMFEMTEIPEQTLQGMATAEVLEAVFNHPMRYLFYAYNSYEQGYAHMKKRMSVLRELERRSDKTSVVANKARALSASFTTSNPLDVDLLALVVGDAKEANARPTVLPSLTLPPIKCTSLFCVYPEYAPITIYTPNGTALPALRLTSGDYSEEKITLIDEYYAETFPLAHWRSRSTARYNCHSFAFVSRQTSKNNVWLNAPNQEGFWDDHSFEVKDILPEDPEELKGIILSYQGADHSAVIWEKRGTELFVLSKWGAAPLMLSNVYYTPYSDEAGYTIFGEYLRFLYLKRVE